MSIQEYLQDLYDVAVMNAVGVDEVEGTLGGDGYRRQAQTILDIARYLGCQINDYGEDLRDRNKYLWFPVAKMTVEHGGTPCYACSLAEHIENLPGSLFKR